MDWHNIYLGFLSAMFLFWNSVRIFTYVPTIRKLMRASASGRDYSLATWGSWVCSNGFFALYLWEQGGRHLNAMVLQNIGNTCMCMVTCYFIAKLQRRSRWARQVSSSQVPAATVDRPTGQRNVTIMNPRLVGPLALLVFVLAGTPVPAAAVPVTVDYGALASGNKPSPLIINGLSAQAGGGGTLATFSGNGLGVLGNDPQGPASGSSIEFNESVLFQFLAGAATNVSFRSTFAFNFAGNPTINIEGFGAGGGSLGTVPFSVFNTFPTYDVSAFFNNVDFSGFRLAGNGENAGLRMLRP